MITVVCQKERSREQSIHCASEVYSIRLCYCLSDLDRWLSGSISIRAPEFLSMFTCYVTVPVSVRVYCVIAECVWHHLGFPDVT